MSILGAWINYTDISSGTFDNTIYTISSNNDTIYIGGRIRNVNGDASLNRLISYDTNTNVFAPILNDIFNSNVSGTDKLINNVVYNPANNKLYAVGTIYLNPNFLNVAIIDLSLNRNDANYLKTNYTYTNNGTLGTTNQCQQVHYYQNDVYCICLGNNDSFLVKLDISGESWVNVDNSAGTLTDFKILSSLNPGGGIYDFMLDSSGNFYITGRIQIITYNSTNYTINAGSNSFIFIDMENASHSIISSSSAPDRIYYANNNLYALESNDVKIYNAGTLQSTISIGVTPTRTSDYGYLVNVLYDTDILYIGGIFNVTDVSGNACRNIAKYDLTSNTLLSLGNGVDQISGSIINGMTMVNNNLNIVGNFDTANQYDGTTASIYQLGYFDFSATSNSGTDNSLNYLVVDSSYISIIGAAAGLSGIVTIPPTINHSGTIYEVRDISGDAFHSNHAITGLDASNSNLEYIHEEAFYSCTNMLSINLRNSSRLKIIYGVVFYNNFEVTSIDLSGCSALTSISDRSFQVSRNLAILNFTNCSSLTSIGRMAFKGGSVGNPGVGLTTLDLSPCISLLSIDAEAFSEQTALSSIIFPNSFIGFSGPHGGSSVFENCSSLTSVSFPVSLTTFGALTFKDCTSLISLTFNGACPSDLNTNGSSLVTSPFLNLPANAKIYVYYAYSSTNPAVGISGFATSYIRGSDIPVIVLDPPVPPQAYNPCMKCPKPVFWNTAQNVSHGSINTAIMRFSNQIQQNKKRGKVKYLPVTQSGRPSPKN